MPIPVEDIPDDDPLGRLIYFPSMYGGSEELLYKQVFQFPSNDGACECLVWSKYATVPDGMHEIGIRDEEAKRARGNPARYDGFMLCKAGKIRAVKSANGHGFSLVHDSSEGDYHVLISYLAAPDTVIRKAERGDLRLLLFKSFEPIVPRERATA